MKTLLKLPISLLLIFTTISCKQNESTLKTSTHQQISDFKIFSSFDGTKIAFTDVGHGIPVVLLHGFINTRKSWDKSALKAQLIKEGFRVIIPDLRGNGDSDQPLNSNAYANSAQSKDISALIDYLNIKTYYCIGYSRGSIVLANHLTRDFRIKKAVLGGMGLNFTIKNWDIPKIFGDAFLGKTPLNDMTKGAVTYASSINANLIPLGHQQTHQPYTSLEAIKNYSAPILVIAGDKDQSNGDPKLLHKAIPKSKLSIVKGEHNHTYKQADFAASIIEFLKQK